MALSWPLARPCCSQGRPCRRPAWPCRSYSTAHPCALPACRARLLRALRTPTPQRLRAQPPAAPCAPACPSAMSWPAWPYRRRKAARLAGRVLGWLCCIATQPSFSSLSQSQYNFCIATLSFSALKPVSVTIVLQYNCTSQPIAIHLKILQYNFFLTIQNG